MYNYIVKFDSLLNQIQHFSSGDIRQFHEDSSSEDMSPSDHKSLRNRTSQGDR